MRGLGTARGLHQLLRELHDVGFPRSADVQGAGSGRLHAEQVRPRHVLYIDEVARLESVAVDARRAPLEELVEEDRHHPRFAERILAGPVDVGVAQAERRHPVRAPVKLDILFAAELGSAVRARRPPRMGLGRGKDVLLAVDRAARGGEDEAPHARTPGRFQGRERPEHVHGGIEERIGDRHAHVHLRREMHHGVGPTLLHLGHQLRIADVEDDELDAVRNGFALSVAEIVDRGHAVSLGEQRPARMRTDESSASGDDDLHGAANLSD